MPVTAPNVVAHPPTSPSNHLRDGPLAFGITSYLVLCTAVYLPSDHPHLQGAAAAMPGRAFVLWDKEFGEAAQAPERSRFNGSKRKVQVGGDLRLGVAAEVRQHQDLALLLGQAGEGAANLMGASIALGQFSAVRTSEV